MGSSGPGGRAPAGTRRVPESPGERHQHRPRTPGPGGAGRGHAFQLLRHPWGGGRRVDGKGLHSPAPGPRRSTPASAMRTPHPPRTPEAGPDLRGPRRRRAALPCPARGPPRSSSRRAQEGEAAGERRVRGPVGPRGSPGPAWRSNTASPPRDRSDAPVPGVTGRAALGLRRPARGPTGNDESYNDGSWILRKADSIWFPPVLTRGQRTRVFSGGWRGSAQGRQGPWEPCSTRWPTGCRGRGPSSSDQEGERGALSPHLQVGPGLAHAPGQRLDVGRKARPPRSGLRPQSCQPGKGRV